MHTILSFIVIGLLAAVVIVLLAGVAGVVRGGDPRRSNQLMRWRVILQALALLFLVLLLKLNHSRALKTEKRGRSLTFPRPGLISPPSLDETPAEGKDNAR
jgi:hypothetical protein